MASKKGYEWSTQYSTSNHASIDPSSEYCLSEFTIPQLADRVGANSQRDRIFALRIPQAL